VKYLQKYAGYIVKILHKAQKRRIIKGQKQEGRGSRDVKIYYGP
jgi:DNA-binding PadR family transcriptional regulator